MHSDRSHSPERKNSAELKLHKIVSAPSNAGMNNQQWLYQHTNSSFPLTDLAALFDHIQHASLLFCYARVEKKASKKNGSL